MPTGSKFEKAFAAARKAGKKEFTWNGKRYNTELKETVRPKPREGKKPTTLANMSTVAAPPPIGKPNPTPKPKTRFEGIREGNQKQREARRDARANRRLARDVRSTLAKTAPKGNKDNKSKEAVKKAMGGKFR